jgi:hypothetical protein
MIGAPIVSIQRNASPLHPSSVAVYLDSRREKLTPRAAAGIMVRAQPMCDQRVLLLRAMVQIWSQAAWLGCPHVPGQGLEGTEPRSTPFRR